MPLYPVRELSSPAYQRASLFPVPAAVIYGCALHRHGQDRGEQPGSLGATSPKQMPLQKPAEPIRCVALAGSHAQILWRRTWKSSDLF